MQLPVSYHKDADKTLKKDHRGLKGPRRPPQRPEGLLKFNKAAGLN